MNRTSWRNAVGAMLAATLLAGASDAVAQADSSNSATDPTFYGAWYFWTPPPSPRYWRYDDTASPQWYAYGPIATFRGPAYYESSRYYDAPVRYYPNPAVTHLGMVTQPGYMGPRDVKP